MSKNDINAFEEALKAIADAAIIGLQYGMTDTDYFAHGAINCSGLKTILQKTPSHFMHQRNEPRKQTAAMLIGSAVHCATLEPERFDDLYVVAPKIDKRTTTGKAAWAELEASGKIVLSMDDGEQVTNISNAVRSHATASQLLTDGVAEISVFSEMDGVPVKCRCDYLRAGAAIIDLKTTDDAGDFNRTVVKYGYAQQAAWYLDVLRAAGEPVSAFVFVVVEKEAPYAVAIYELSQEWIEIGRVQNTTALSIYKNCTESNDWYSYGEDIALLEPPTWMKGKQV